MAKKNKVKKIKGWHNISAGLFGYRGRYWFRNIKDLWILIKRVFFVLRHGYSPQALWEMDAWFIDVMKELLTWQRDNRMSVGYFEKETVNEDENKEKTDELLNHMLGLLEKADPFQTGEFEEAEKAKNEFLELFSKYFYKFWD